MDKTDQDLYEFLIAWVRKAIGIPAFQIIIANQNGRQPSGEFATLKVGTRTSLGLAQTVEDLSADELTKVLYQTGLTNADVSLQFFRGNAHEYARKVLFFPNTNESKNYLHFENISLHVPNNFTTLDQELEDGFIARTQIDLSLHSVTEYVETVNVIDDVEVIIEN